MIYLQCYRKNCYELALHYNKFVYLLVRLLKMHFRQKVHFLFMLIGYKFYSKA